MAASSRNKGRTIIIAQLHAPTFFRLLCVESTTGAVAVASRWVVGSAFALPPQSGVTGPRFLSPLIEPGVRISRNGLSDNASCFRPRKVARSYTQPGESQG